MFEKKKLLIFGEDNFKKSNSIKQEAIKLSNKYNISQSQAECYLMSGEGFFCGKCNNLNKCREINNDYNRD